MAFRDLTEPECAGQNSLMRLGSHVTRDVALKDEGLARSVGFASSSRFDGNDLVNEFFGQIVPPPQSFHMDVLLKEMREIDQQMSHRNIRAAPPVIEQVNQGIDWANEYGTKVNTGHDESLADAWKTAQRFQQYSQRNQQPPMVGGGGADTRMWTRQFFEINEGAAEDQIRKSATELVNTVSQDASEQINYSEFVKFMNDVSDGKTNVLHELPDGVQADDWIKDFEQGKQKEAEDTEQYNKQYWDRLQEEWKKIAGDDEASQHPWLSEFSDYYDPYKEYKFDEENPMIDVENAYEKAKAFLAQGDIPSAVLCLESAVKQDPENAEIWEVLGVSQAENEKDPNAIAALKTSISLNPNNLKALMALAVSYTNESLQNQALRTLVSWLQRNEKYAALVPANLLEEPQVASSLIGSPSLLEVQDLFLNAAQRNPQNDIDKDIQEALGVLFNLSSEYDKAADCFRSALQVEPQNSKIWNRLGASLANGNRSVEAVDAYQRALELQPGFIRARYNVGIICINLKAYKEAAEHFLMALNHQNSSTSRSGLGAVAPGNQMSDTIWQTMRMLVSLMGRDELQAAVSGRNLDALNRALMSDVD